MEIKIFEICNGTDTVTIVAGSEAQARDYFDENVPQNGDIESVVEIPESEWDTRKIEIFADNNTENKPFYVTFKEESFGMTSPGIICSTDLDFLN